MRDSGFDYLANRNSFYQPKTPFAALKAAEKGLVPADCFTFMASSVEAITDNPENLEEIERMLGQKHRDLDTNILLVDVLNILIKNKDKEVALFAAESLNAIENDYNRAVEALDEDQYLERAVLYTEMSILNKSVSDLKNFYLREAFSNYRQLVQHKTITASDRLAMSRILIELGLLGQAKNIIVDNGLDKPDALFILADIAFRERNYKELFTIIKNLNQQRSILDINQRIIVDFWMEKE